MTPTPLLTKLDPSRFPRLSPHLVAILGYLLERAYTTPTLVELRITPDGRVVGRTDDQVKSCYLGGVTELRAHLRRLGMAAGLDAEEWASYLELVQRKLGARLEEPADGQARRHG